MSSEERFCLIPEAGLNVTPDGTITPCCVISSDDRDEYKLGHISKDSLSSAFQSEKYKKFREMHRQGNLPKVCVSNCIDRNNNFVHRAGRNNLVKLAEQRENKPADQEKLILLDIGIGNVCNLTCTFCNETWSSAWAKLKNKNSNIFYFDYDTTVNIAKELSDMEFISFKGGEPLNIPHLDKFLEELYKNNSNCLLNMVSNGVEASNRIIENLFKFNVTLTISTEATGELYQYMRGGKHTWDNVLANLKLFAEHGCKDLCISSVISAYNYTTWAKDMLVIKQQLESLNLEVGINSQLCIFPEEESLFILNLEQRQRLVNSIEQHIDQGLEIQGWDDMKTSILADRKVNTTLEKIQEKINYNNKMRNMNLFSIVEDFRPYISL